MKIRCLLFYFFALLLMLSGSACSSPMEEPVMLNGTSLVLKNDADKIRFNNLSEASAQSGWYDLKIYYSSKELFYLKSAGTMFNSCWEWQPQSLGLAVPLSVYDATTNGTYFYSTDANKNVSDVTDSAGNIVAHYEYSPFGTQTVAIAVMQQKIHSALVVSILIRKLG